MDRQKCDVVASCAALLAVLRCSPLKFDTLFGAMATVYTMCADCVHVTTPANAHASARGLFRCSSWVVTHLASDMQNEDADTEDEFLGYQAWINRAKQHQIQVLTKMLLLLTQQAKEAVEPLVYSDGRQWAGLHDELIKMETHILLLNNNNHTINADDGSRRFATNALEAARVYFAHYVPPFLRNHVLHAQRTRRWVSDKAQTARDKARAAIAVMARRAARRLGKFVHTRPGKWFLKGAKLVSPLLHKKV